MKSKIASSDSDILASLKALRRAARNARKLAETTGTPFYVVRNGRVVNLNPTRKPRKSA